MINGNITITCSDDDNIQDISIINNDNELNIEFSQTLANFEALHNTKADAHENLFTTINDKNDSQDTLISQLQNNKANTSDIPTKLSDLINDENYISDISDKANTSLNNLSPLGISKIKSFIPEPKATPFCVNSGSTDEYGEANCLQLPQDSTITITHNWTQPQLAGNGTIGGEYFAVLPSYERSGLSGGGQCFRAFDGASNTFWMSSGASVASPVTCVIYSPTSINISYMYFSGSGGNTGKLQASTDGSTWIDLKEFSYSTNTYGLDTSDNTGYYNYYRLYYTAGGYHGSGGWYVYLNEISITATYQETIQSSSVIILNGADKEITLANTNGTIFIINDDRTMDAENLTDGTYNVFYNPQSDTLSPYKNTIYRQIEEPSTPELADIWYNTGTNPAKAYQYDGTNWEDFDFIPIGNCTVQNEQITSCSTFPYNTNGTSNRLIANYTYNNTLYTVKWIWDKSTNSFTKWVFTATSVQN